MRGKIKPETRYQCLRKDILEIYKDHPQKIFYLMFKNRQHLDSFSNVKEFDWDSRTPAHVLYHVLRIAKSSVRWCELENLADYCFFKNQNTAKDRQRILTEAFAVLYSFGLVGYKVVLENDSEISNSLYVFIQEDYDD